MAELQVSQRYKLLQVAHESTVAGIAEMGDVMNVRSRRRERPPQYFFEVGTVDARSQPIGAHVLGRGEVVLSCVLHRKELSECPAKTRQQPVRVVLHGALWCLTLLNEVGNNLDDNVFRQSVEVDLQRMQGPVATPVVVQIDLYGLVPLINTVGEKVLNARVLSI